MGVRTLVGYVVTAAVAPNAATKVVDPVGVALYQAESPETGAKHDAARPGPPYRVAEKPAQTVGLSLSNHATKRAGTGFDHSGLVRMKPAEAVGAEPARKTMQLEADREPRRILMSGDLGSGGPQRAAGLAFEPERANR